MSSSIPGLYPIEERSRTFKLAAGAGGKEPTCQCRRFKRHRFDSWVGKIPWRRKWQPTSVLLPGKIPWTEGPGGPQSMGSQRVGHDWATEHAGHWPLGHEVHKFLQTLPNSLGSKSPLTENHRFMKVYINIKFTRTAKQSTTVGWLNRCLLCHSSGGQKCEIHMWAGMHSSGSWERMCPRSLP